MRQLMEERVMKAEGSQLSEKAYIYNGFEDIELKYAGRIWNIPANEVTEIKPFTWREVDQNKSDGVHTVMELHSVEGEVVARELVEKHGWNEAGIMVFLKEQTTTDADGTSHTIGLNAQKIEELKERCHELGKRYKAGKIDEFRKGREMARAGRAGNRLHPSENEIRWMKELGVEDEIFNPTNIQGDMEGKMRMMVQAALEPFAKMLGGLISKEGDKALKPPVRKPLEKIEDYKKRVKAWENGEGIAEVTEEPVTE